MRIECVKGCYSLDPVMLSPIGDIKKLKCSICGAKMKYQSNLLIRSKIMATKKTKKSSKKATASDTRTIPQLLEALKNPLTGQRNVTSEHRFAGWGTRGG